MTPIASDPPPDTRRRLMEAALLVFAEKGYDGAGIREVAERAKANSAMVQYHFGGKEGLYRESLRYAFKQGPCHVMDLPPPPPPHAPGAVEAAKEYLRGFVRNFLDEFFLCHGSGKYLPVEVEQAAKDLWTREMQKPRASLEDFLLESLKPYKEYLDACVLALRPDLSEEERFLMGTSIQAQILFLHKNMELIRLLRGQAYTAADIPILTDHVTTFSLRGLGFPEGIGA